MHLVQVTNGWVMSLNTNSKVRVWYQLTQLTREQAIHFTENQEQSVVQLSTIGRQAYQHQDVQMFQPPRNFC
jgi:hypothetical protein